MKQKERILILDDDEPVRSVISEAANSLGCETVSALSGKEAVDVLRKESFSVLITSLGIPQIDGVEWVKAVKKEFPALSIICLVGPEGADGPDPMEMTGCEEYLEKPFTVRDMKARLGRVIHERVRFEELTQQVVELEIANGELKRLDQLKSNFVSGISEELQTPVTVIREFVSLMLKGQAGPLSEEQKEYLGVASKNTLRLSNLIEKLLDFSRIEAGKVLRLKLKPTRLIEVVEDALMALSQQIEDKKITVENHLDAETPVALVDRSRVMEVFVNLVGNGIKFTPPGGKIVIDSRGLTEDRSQLKLVVSDTGVGVAPEDLPKIFDRFFQGQRTPEGGIKGTGQGLSITKEIIEGHQGVIQAESKVSGGASFTFTLPLYGINTIFQLMIHPMLEEAEHDALPLSLIQVEFWNQQTKRETTFALETREELVCAIQKMVRSVDTVVPAQDHKIYILTFNDKKLAKEIGKRVQGKLTYGSYVPKRTDVQFKTFSYRSMKAILSAGLDRHPENAEQHHLPGLLPHQNIRGQAYYQRKE